MGKGGEIIISLMGTEVGCAGRRKAKEQRWKGGKRKGGNIKKRESVSLLGVFP